MSDEMTLKYYVDQMRRRLETVVEAREAYWIARDVVEDVVGYTEVDFLLKGDELLSPFVIERLEQVVERLLKGEPVQIVLGWARFYGCRFKVTGDTLIPRPETQELVDMIVSRHGDEKDLRVIDVGTGSGCIAIALARGLKFPNVTAIDISQSALEVAQYNAKEHKADVTFVWRDALRLEAMHDEKYDIIVSNPPYIAQKERADMEAVVLDHEPSLALFVPDEDPLCFYRSIAQWGSNVLRVGGAIYFEINPLYATEMVSLMHGLGYDDVTVVKDMQGRDRFLRAVKIEP